MGKQAEMIKEFGPFNLGVVRVGKLKSVRQRTQNPPLDDAVREQE